MKISKWILTGTGILLLMSLTFIGCGSSESKPSAQKPVESESSELYTCGMHPNVIQEGPGNCPICGMKLNPLNGGGTATAEESSAATEAKGERKILYWQAPMDPSYISPKQGKSPMGMDLIPVYEGEEAFGSTVKINPVIEQNMGIRTGKALRKDLSREIRAVARIEMDESRVGHIHTKISGWIEKMYVSTTGEYVKKGQKLLEIYSPQLVSAQDEYLDAFNNAKSLPEGSDQNLRQNFENILHSAKTRLQYYDISDDQIIELEESGIVRKTLVFKSPFEGYVMKKHALEGMEVKPGMQLYTIADLSTVWIQADIYESEMPWVEVGNDAEITLSYYPGESIRGKIDYIYPYMETKTRTIKVRLVFDNPDLKLKPGMYSNVVIQTSPVKNAVSVPQEAVLFSGERTLVFVALDGGRFVPRDVKIGVESGDGYYEIQSGLKEGESIVLSGQFLLDSESRLQESIAKMLANRQAGKNSSGETAGESTHSDGDEPNHDAHEMPEMKKEMNMKTHSEDKEHDHNSHEVEGMDMNMNEHSDSHSSNHQHSISFGTINDGQLTYYTCPMESHSFVKVAEPGDCPECGMHLVKKTISVDENSKFYTCPMPEHNFVVTEEPGECPECGMNLVLMPSLTDNN